MNKKEKNLTRLFFALGGSGIIGGAFHWGVEGVRPGRGGEIITAADQPFIFWGGVALVIFFGLSLFWRGLTFK